jgi:hypothetical protein
LEPARFQTISKISDKPMIVVPGPVPIEPEMGTGPERRRAVGYSFTAAAEIIGLSSHARLAGRWSDQGPGGSYIDLVSPFAVGSATRVRREPEKKVFEAMATVTYAQLSMGMGLKFTELEPEHSAVLRSWMAELCGEASPKFDAVDAGPESCNLSTVLSFEQILNELVSIMVHKKVINETEGPA